MTEFIREHAEEGKKNKERKANARPLLVLWRQRRRSGPKDLGCCNPKTLASCTRRGKNTLSFSLTSFSRSLSLSFHAVFFSAWEPSRKPFLARRGRSLRWRMRPVPVVLRRMALLAQLSVFFYVYVFVLEVVGVEEKER